MNAEQHHASERRSAAWARLGAYLKAVREAHDLKQKPTAERLNELGVTGRHYRQGQISEFEAGRRMKPEVVTDYIAAFGLDRQEVNAILEGGADMTSEERTRLFNGVVDADPSLDADTRRHLKRQRLFLQRASNQAIGGESRPGDEGEED